MVVYLKNNNIKINLYVVVVDQTKHQTLKSTFERRESTIPPKYILNNAICILNSLIVDKSY